MLQGYLGLAGHTVYWENTHFSGSLLSHQPCVVLLQTQHQTWPPCPEPLSETETTHRTRCKRGWSGLWWPSV